MAKYRTCKNAFEFESDLNEAAKVLGAETAREAAVTLAIQLSTEIVRRTPVDTGRARANWFLSEGTPRIETTSSTSAQSFSASALTGRNPIYITNSLPYIVPLEYGHSKQAPAGMVRTAIAMVMARFGGKSLQ